jgi:hypothetical protein
MTTRIARCTVLLSLAAFIFICADTALAQDQGIGRDCDDRNANRPTISLAADRNQVLSGQRVHLTATGTGTGGETVEYFWRADAGKFYGRGASVDFDTTGLAPGNYNVTLIGRGHECGTSSQIVPIAVIGCPPDLRLSASNVRVRAGETVTISADGLTSGLGLTWSTSAGRMMESGTSVTIDTAGITADTITVSASALDIPDCARDITIAVERPPVALPDILSFPMTGGRLNNANKAILDDVSLRSGQDVQAQIVITGRSTAGERRGIAQTRAENARNYLVNEKGIDPARIEVRTEEGTAAEGGVQIAIVPPGAQMP